jgi:signal transduction histidine kinase
MSRFDLWVESVYRRTKPRYDWILLGSCMFVLSAVLTPAFVVMMGPFWSRNPDDWLDILITLEKGELFGHVALIWVVRAHHESLIRYLRGGRVDPEDLWMTSVVELPQGVRQGLVGYMVPLLVAGYFVGRDVGFSTTAQLATGVAIAIAALGASAFIFLFWELALRPVVREIAPRLPPDLVLRAHGPSLAAKLGYLLLTLTLFSGVAVGGVALNDLEHDTALVVTIGAAILLSCTVAGALVWMIEHSFVSRIDELSRALQGLETGRLDVVLPPLAADDLDEAGHAFNEMVQRLRRHDADMQASRARIVTVAVNERRRMERDLHDGAQQHLALLNLQLGVLERHTTEHPDIHAQVLQMRATVTEALAEMRNLAHGIYPAALENDGLAAALAGAGSRASVPTSVFAEGVGRTAREIEAAVYFCCLEALQNAGKHAGTGARAAITLAQRNGNLDFTIVDNGVGFDPGTKGHGLDNMRDRIGALGGSVMIDTALGRGVTIRGTVPVTPVTSAIGVAI